MLLLPKKTKFKRVFTRKNKENKNHQKIEGFFGGVVLCAIDYGIITSQHLESIRRSIRKKLKKKAKIFSHIFPHLPLTKKSQGLRMGKGKGNVKKWVSLVDKRCLLFEIRGVKNRTLKVLLKNTKKKLAIKSFFF